MTIQKDHWHSEIFLSLILLIFVGGERAIGQTSPVDDSPSADSRPAVPSLTELRTAGALASRMRKHETQLGESASLDPDLPTFHEKVQPVLAEACSHCHGPDHDEGHIRIDRLDPDLFDGSDANRWLEVLAVLTNGEMPPPGEGELADDDRTQVIEWLSAEIQRASAARRSEHGHSSFRRMTRYEYKYALQDLLGLPLDFAKDLPPDPISEDGFHNSSEVLHMSVAQLEIYRSSARNALRLATVNGDKPSTNYWGVSMKAAAANTWAKQNEQIEQAKKDHENEPEKLNKTLEQLNARWRERQNSTHYKDLATGRTGRAEWRYPGAKYAWEPASERSIIPTKFDQVAIIPPRKKLIIELGDRIPEKGTLRVRVLAARTPHQNHIPSLQLEFGWQASNDSAASVKISQRDLPIDAEPDAPKSYQWDVPLSDIYPRNSVRNISKMGDLPSPSELIKLVNSSETSGDIQVYYVEVIAPFYHQWPPDSHAQIFFDSPNRHDEELYAREILTDFMPRAWRRSVTSDEITQKLTLFKTVRPNCNDFHQAMVETLASVLSSPKFLYLTNPNTKRATPSALSDVEVATRLAIFLWSSVPDKQLLEIAEQGKLTADDMLERQVERMLADPRARRFSRQFVRQWLGMQLLDYLDVDRKTYRNFDQPLKEAMQEEPVAFFREILQNNYSILDFVHADYTMANERLAKHYGLVGVAGNHFRRVELSPDRNRGGLLTHAGLLAMNSDGKDSHPLKRGIWMLEKLLNDPPPPPPPAVPEIDLSDPKIAKMTLKQRIEDHRNDAACMLCHAKIDPWGIAFENFDAVGSWRTHVQDQPVDSSSQLFNGQQIFGMDGLKRYLLLNRQDQFVRAMVHKMTTYAMGRPLSFGDRASVDQIASELRREGDGLATMIKLIVCSELFRSRY